MIVAGISIIYNWKVTVFIRKQQLVLIRLRDYEIKISMKGCLSTKSLKTLYKQHDVEKNSNKIM